MNLIDFIIVGIFNIVSFIINIIFLPVNIIIATFLPDLNTAFASINTYLNLIFSYIGWAISVTGIPSLAIALVVLYTTFKLTLPMQVWLIKLGVHWYTALKP